MSRKLVEDMWREELKTIRDEHQRKQAEQNAKLPQRLANYRKRVIRLGGVALFVIGGIGMIAPLILLNLTLASPIFIVFAIVASVGAFMAALPQVVQRILGEKPADTGIEMTAQPNTAYRADFPADRDERQGLLSKAAATTSYGSGAAAAHANGMPNGGAHSAGPSLFDFARAARTGTASAARLDSLTATPNAALDKEAEAMRARIVARFG